MNDLSYLPSFSRYYHRNPGPRRGPWQMRYFTFGFVHLQDIVEHAIIKMHTGLGGLKSGVGIFTQQFPFPCYVRDR